MTVLFWILVGVGASVLVSAVAIPLCIFGGYILAKRLYDRGHFDGDYRMYLLMNFIEQLVGAPDKGKKSEEETKKEFIEFWTGVADILIARMKEIDAKTAGGVISGKTTEARGLLDLLKKAKEDPKGVFEALAPPGTF